MIDVYISNECFKLIQSRATLPFTHGGTQLSSGEWKVPLEEETIERLSKYQQKGESLSDTIFRILSTRQ